MNRARLIASVTWGRCPAVAGRPHLGEAVLFAGHQSICSHLMGQPALWAVRAWLCQFCHAATRLPPTAIIIEDWI